MVKETKRQPDIGDDGDWQALQVMSREQKERLKYKGLQTYIFSQNIHRAEAANSHLSGGAKKVYVTLQKDKHPFKIKLLFLPDMQANQTHHRQKKLHAVSCEFSWCCKAPQGTKLLWYFLHWVSTSICWGLEKQGLCETERSEQQLADLNRKQGDHHKPVKCIFCLRMQLFPSLQC